MRTFKNFVIFTLLLFSIQSIGQSFPNKPVKIIVPYGAGGISDIAARIIANKLSQMWQQAVIVDNKVGGGGFIAMNAVAKSDPDGHTLLVATVAEFTIAQHLNKNQSLNTANEFIPISLLLDTPMLIVANADKNINSVAQLINQSKAQTGGISFASPGIGTLNHLMGERFAAEAGAKLVHIPYKGGAQAVLAIVSGEAPIGVAGAAVVTSFIESGKLKVLGLASRQRSKDHPDWPTLIESGLKDFVESNWVAIAAPQGVPKEIIQKMNTDINKVLQLDDVKEQILKLGAEPVGSSPEILSERIKKDSDRYGKLIEKLKLKLD
jgi:tripartite-type tricarboxylate transporter receptor subunit TctC